MGPEGGNKGGNKGGRSSSRVHRENYLVPGIRRRVSIYNRPGGRAAGKRIDSNLFTCGDQELHVFTVNGSMLFAPVAGRIIKYAELQRIITS